MSKTSTTTKKDALKEVEMQNKKTETPRKKRKRPKAKGTKKTQEDQSRQEEPEKLNDWLPWVHKFISNAKAWIIGTHHGVNVEYFKLYLAEYTYRFNRRHDVKKYFSRALFACCISGKYQFG